MNLFAKLRRHSRAGDGLDWPFWTRLLWRVGTFLRRVDCFFGAAPFTSPVSATAGAAALSLFFFLLSLAYLGAIVLFGVFIVGAVGGAFGALFVAVFCAAAFWRWTRYLVFPALLVLEHWFLFSRVLSFLLPGTCLLSGVLVTLWFTYLLILPESWRVGPATRPVVRRWFSFAALFILLWPLFVCFIAPTGLLTPKAPWAWLLLADEFLMLAVTAGGAAIAAGLMSKLDATFVVRRWFCTFCFSLPFIIFAAAYIDFYLVFDDRSFDRICAQPSVVPLYSYKRGLYSSSALRFVEVRNIVEGCRPDVYYLSTARLDSELIELDTAAQTARLLAGARPNEGLDIGCQDGAGYAYVSGDNGVLLKIDVQTGRPERIAAGKLNAALQDIRLAGGGRWLFTLRDSPTGAAGEDVVALWDTRGLTRAWFLSGEVRRIAVREDMLFVKRRGWLLGYRFDRERGALTKAFERELDLGEMQLATHHHIAAQQAAPYVYVLGARRLHMCDLQTGRPLFTHDMGLGFRYLSISPDGRVIASANHGDGRLYFFDARRGGEISNVFIGKKGGWVRFSRDGKYALAPSKAGGFKVRLPAAPEGGADQRF